MPNDSSELRTSPTLLERVRFREPQAWQRFVAIYGPSVYAWGRAAGLREHDAADVAQDVFRAVFTSIDRFRKDQPNHRFRDWLWTITRRRAIDHVRKLAAQPGAAGGSTAHLRMQELPEDSVESVSASQPGFADQIVGRTLDHLRSEFKENTWKAFIATAIDGRTADEVGTELGMSVGAVYVARSRVLKRLRAELAGLL